MKHQVTNRVHFALKFIQRSCLVEVLTPDLTPVLKSEYNKLATMASPRCPSCIELGTLTCACCKNVKYCSTSCQQTDWQFHKVLCKSFKKFEIRPSQDMRRVIYFPADQAKPEFRWLPLKRLMDDDGQYEVAQSINYKTLVGEAFLKPSSFNRNNLVDATLDVTIDLCYDDAFLLKYSENNKAAMLATNWKMGHPWRGPMVAYCGYVATGSWVPEIVGVVDMDMKTYSDLIAYLIDYANDSHPHRLRKGPKIKAVKINCIGEQRVNKVPFAQMVEIPRMHPIFDTGDTSAISKVQWHQIELTQLLAD